MKSLIPLVDSVLHPTDFSDASHRAFAHALAISLIRQTNLTILHVGKAFGGDVNWNEFPQVRKTLERWKLLDSNSRRSAVFDELGVRVSKHVERRLNPIQATREFLEDRPHDLVVLATEGSSSRPDWLHSSDAEAIARGSGAMTLFVPSRASRGIVSLEDGDLNLKNILVPIDEKINGVKAIEFARRAAEIIGDGDVSITIFHVGEQMPPIPELAAGSGWTWQTLLSRGEPVESILAAADKLEANLIVMTTNGRDTLDQALLGSTTERVIRKANCPLLAVPAGN
ncbi:MAG: universal stress protein [Gammaproteobacteria bacterium]|nr:MAG: universal stress protein [Gammaproteobacteria bacterium]